MRRHVGLLAAAGIALAVIAVSAVSAIQDGVAMRYVDRVAGRDISLGELVARIGDADVLIIGGTPGDAALHRAEARLLDALAAKRTDVTLALEILDRQAQEPLDHFQMGHLSEAEFLAGVERPWTGYARDYKAIVDAAIARGWSIVAAAAPHPIVDAVAAGGLAVLDRLPPNERSLVAGRHACANANLDAAQHLPGPYSSAAFCLESDTIAESIAQAHAAGAIGGGKPLVIALVQRWRLGHLRRLAGDVLARMSDGDVAGLDIVPADAMPSAPLAANDAAIPRFAIYVGR